MLLRKNREDVSKHDTDGFNLRVILGRLDQMDASQEKRILRQAEFAKWIQSELGMNPSQVARQLVLLHSTKWRNLFWQFVETSYGETFFQWTPVEQWIATKLDEVSLYRSYVMYVDSNSS
jgi:hypothetical protein